MTREKYVSQDIYLLMKKKGFDGWKRAILYGDGDMRNWGYTEAQIFPSLAVAMEWLREVHHIHVCPEYKTFFQERPKKIYHHWCNKIIGIGRCFQQGIQDLNELDSDYFYHHGCKTYHDTFEEACEECVDFVLKNLI